MDKEKFDQEFVKLIQGVFTDGALTVREKELIALACGIAHQCEGCIETHVNACKRAGVSLEELEELTTVTSLMGGGPGLSYSNKALAKAYEIY